MGQDFQWVQLVVANKLGFAYDDIVSLILLIDFEVQQQNGARSFFNLRHANQE